MGRRLIQKEEIQKAMKRQGYFSVTWRYRDDYLRTMCRNLGYKLKSSKGGVDIFVERECCK